MCQKNEKIIKCCLTCAHWHKGPKPGTFFLWPIKDGYCWLSFGCNWRKKSEGKGGTQ